MPADSLAPAQRGVFRPSLDPRDAAGRALARWGAAAAVAAIAVAGVWLRLRMVGAHYWVDEGLSVGIAGHPVSDLHRLLRQDGSPPLYYVLLHVWMQLFGRGEIVTHELSLIFSLLTIPAAWWAGSSIFDRRTGLVAAALASGTPYVTHYAQETRMYALLLLLSLIVAASFVHAFVGRRRRYVPVFALSLSAALYTHNWSLFLAAVCGATFLSCVREAAAEERRDLWRDGLIAFGAVAVLYAPWLPTVVYQARHTGAPWAMRPTLWSVTQSLDSVVGGRGGGVALLLGAGTGLSAVWAARRLPRGDRTYRPLAALLLIAIGTLATAFLYSKVTPAWAIRYMAVFVGPMLPVVALGLARAGRLGMVALALACSFWLLDPLDTSVDAKSNVATALEKLESRLGTDPLVLSTQPEQVPTISYYLPGVTHFVTPLGRVPDPRVLDWRGALERLDRSSVAGTLAPMLHALAPGRRVLLVTPLNLAHKPAWMMHINSASHSWTAFMDHDRHLRRIMAVGPHSTVSGLAIRATLFVTR